MKKEDLKKEDLEKDTFESFDKELNDYLENAAWQFIELLCTHISKNIVIGVEVEKGEEIKKEKGEE